MKKYNGQSFDQSTAYFLIDFSKTLEVLDIKTLKGFSTRMDNQITNFLKNEAKWHTGILGQGSKVDSKTKYVISIYYDQKDKSFSPSDM